MNRIIEEVLNTINVPHAFLFFDEYTGAVGEALRYIVYQQTDADGVLASDDAIANYVDYYDFDIYTKFNYFDLENELIEKLQKAGFTWQPSRSSGDMYEPETGYYHKTLCFAIERSVN